MVIVLLYAAEILLSGTWHCDVMLQALMRRRTQDRARMSLPSVLFLVGSTQMDLLSTW